MATYIEYIFGLESNIYDMLEKGYGHYNRIEFIQLLRHARNNYYALQEENKKLKVDNEKLKLELNIINISFISTLERDINHMRNSLNTVIKPKYSTKRTIEQLDV
jgi:hypothetical protein